MSSLAAVQADGFYHPPNYDPRKHGSLSRFHGSRGHNQFMKRGVVRLELPEKAVCLKCEKVYEQGTRFNAKKKQEGNYYSTKIFKFSFNCMKCQEPFIMKTDPKNSAYIYESGFRKFITLSEKLKIGKEIDESEHQILSYLSDGEKEKLEENPLLKLQHREADKKRAKESNVKISHALKRSKAWFKDDFGANSALRATMRQKRKNDHEYCFCFSFYYRLKLTGKTLGFAYRLIPESKEDEKLSKKVRFKKKTKENQIKNLRNRVKKFTSSKKSVTRRLRVKH
eukprot:maker-scaffold_29-snap-gene-2.7-mRNA-1 protein AED:0.11 eAED:0.11 QI:93/1/1/1/1/1/2/995/281